MRIALAFIFILSNLIVFSQDKKDYIIGVENINYYPIYSWDGKEYKGYARDVLDSFAKKSGYKFVYKALPITRLFNDFIVKEELDFKFPDNPLWSSDIKKDKNVIYSNSVVAYIDGLLVLPENKKIELSDLKSLGIVRGFTAWEYLDLINSKKILLKESTDYTGLLVHTINKNTDAAYSNIVVANYHLNEILKKPKQLVFNEKLPYTKSSYYISTIKHKKVIDEFNKFLITEKKTVDALKKKYNVEEAIISY